MTHWKQSLLQTAHKAAAQAEARFDSLKNRLRERVGRLDPVVIQPYRGFGTPEQVVLWGRVLEDEGIPPAEDRDTVWDNIVATYRRFESDEVPDARVRAALAGAETTVTTDEEGYFEAVLRPTEPLPAHKAWHAVELELLDAPAEALPAVTAMGPVLVPPPSAGFGIISDVDDTILKTDATSLLQMARLTFLQNARTRLPFRGVAAFYRGLQDGPDGRSANPVFFVSSSPWNLYDLLVDFCEHQGIPRGPFLLRDLGLDREKFIKAGHRAHKLAQIEKVLATYPDLPFVLIGDSGQKDPEIYRQVVEDFPGRVRAIYIRDVSMDARDEEVQALAETLAAQDVPMLLAADTAAAATDAARRGLITEAAAEAVRSEAEAEAA